MELEETTVVETTPPAGSSPETTPPEGGGDKTPESKPDREAFIPRERFDQVNEKLGKALEEIDGFKTRFDGIDERLEKNKQPDKEEDEVDPEAPLTQGDLKKWEDKKKDQEFQTQINNRHTELEKEIDGKDGRPAYKKSEIVAFVRKNPEKAAADPMDVYRLMNYDKLVDWAAGNKLKTQKPDNVEKPSPASKKPDSPKDFKDSKSHDDFIREKYRS